jgi:LL-diaminopimelate aminotransferase
MNPTYPEYFDSSIMCGNEIIFLPCKPENNFNPEIPKNKKIDLIYICNPNNPTGTAINKDNLKLWIDYALENNSVILYDSAYNKFISSPNIPKSIYEIDGAKKTCIEFCSFSKFAGFTGLRCGYTVISKELRIENILLNTLWNRRQSTKTNGVSYITQCAAKSVYSDEVSRECKNNIDYYLKNAMILRNGLIKSGYEVYGGIDAPYVWLKIPKKYTCWQWFDLCLEKFGIVGIPGIGFGSEGKNYFRLSSFGSRDDILKAIAVV